MIKGNGIQKQIDNFKNKSGNILFINSFNFGSGLNLEESDVVILYHKLDKNIFDQVIGRALRINRNKKLDVIQLKYIDE